MRVVVTGARGKVGRAVVAAVQGAGHEVTEVDLVAPVFEAALPGEPAYLRADLTDAGEAFAVVRGAEVVVHAAAIPDPLHHPPQVVFHNNVMSVFNVLEAAVRPSRTCPATKCSTPPRPTTPPGCRLARPSGAATATASSCASTASPARTRAPSPAPRPSGCSAGGRSAPGATTSTPTAGPAPDFWWFVASQLGASGSRTRSSSPRPIRRSAPPAAPAALRSRNTRMRCRDLRGGASRPGTCVIVGHQRSESDMHRSAGISDWSSTWLATSPVMLAPPRAGVVP